MRGNKVVKNIGIVMLTLVLVLGLALAVSGTVLSQPDGERVADEAVLRTLEREYIKEIREYLTMQGFENSGVTLNWVMESDGSRSYEVVLHHKEIGSLSLEAREMLFKSVEALAFEVTGCNFRVKLLV